MTVVIGVGILVLVVAVYVVVTYNRLVRMRNNVDNSWAQVDVALKMRHDLVPNLARTVQGYAAHERATVEAVTQARAAAEAVPAFAGPELGAAESKLAQLIGRLLVVAEGYPALKASDNFLALQQQLTAIENQMQITRRVYNDTVETYRTHTQRIPAAIVANAGGFEPRDFFQAPVESHAAPVVTV